jgi:hypothetical protein
LAFEYQGETHYFSSHTFGSASVRQHADSVKRRFSNAMGITLISIPFWWDNSPESLAATIQRQRPDIPLSSNALPISTNMPEKYQREFKYKPSIAREYKDDLDPTGWYL